jgi:hypothetical protein
MSRTPHDEVKLYLKINSLVARNLTIMSVFRRVTVTMEDAQIVDRYLVEKIWDDVCLVACRLLSISLAIMTISR